MSWHKVGPFQTGWKQRSNAWFLMVNVAKMYPFLIDNSELEKAKGMNKNVVATKNHNEYKDILLNNKNISHSINRTQSNDRIIGTYEINKISEDDKK